MNNKRQIRLSFNIRKQKYEYRLEKVEGTKIVPQSEWREGYYDVENTAIKAESQFGRLTPMTIEA
jgi:hypothetical protein